MQASKTLLARALDAAARARDLTPKQIALWLDVACSNLEAGTSGGEENNLRPYLVRDGGCFVDVGANFGMHSKYVSDRDVEVFAFEPDPRAFEVLRRTAPRAHLYPCAVGDQTVEKTAFSLHRDTSSSRLRGKFSSQGTDYLSDCAVRMVRLDDVRLPTVGVLKIDTEGWELPVLEGAVRLIKHDRPRVIAEIHSPREQNKELVINFMRQLGYSRIRQIWKSSRNEYHLIFFELVSLQNPIEAAR